MFLLHKAFGVFSRKPDRCDPGLVAVPVDVAFVVLRHGANGMDE